MSVINKMLRDIDARQSRDDTVPAALDLGPQLHLGDAPRDMAGTSNLGRWGYGLLGAVILGAMVLGALSHFGVPDMLRPAAPAEQPRPVVAVSAVPEKVPAAAEPVVEPEPAVVAAPPMPTPPPKAEEVPAQSQKVDANKLTLKLEKNLKTVRPHAPVPQPAAPLVTAASRPPLTAAEPSSASGANVVVQPPGLQRQLAAQEAMASAQQMWASGSRDAAMDLMREAVLGVERAQLAGNFPEAVTVLPPMVRELARMQLVEGRVAQTMDMLIRLEPLIKTQADLWAVRGNAAQRLGRYADSVQAYQEALQLRPQEARWMLGMAVSLAAQGQIAEAAPWAEKARLAGAVSPEINQYLRQLGVAVK